jgi:archaellum component FlaC
MSSGKDISIDEARAQAWINDVNAEILQVEDILQKVDNELTTVADEEDPIMSGIATFGREMADVNENMVREFKSAMDTVQEAVDKLIDGIRMAVDEIRSHHV